MARVIGFTFFVSILTAFHAFTLHAEIVKDINITGNDNVNYSYPIQITNNYSVNIPLVYGEHAQILFFNMYTGEIELNDYNELFNKEE